MFRALFIGVTSCKDAKKTNFEKNNKAENWNLVFEDNCIDDWTKQWTLDGVMGVVENSEDGMQFRSGSAYENDAHHAVLWTKKSFTGDMTIEYDYIRTDTVTRGVNILYIQATGNGEGVYKKDISKWKNLRKIPAMKTYFENMNTFHISYSAFGNKERGFHYVRARRYPKPDKAPFKVTQIAPSFDQQDFFKTGEVYHITAIKTRTHLSFKMESTDGIEFFEWDISNIAPIEEGRVGLRQMYTRSSLYKNFKIYSK